jgi:copper(I)-binding protein
MWCRNPVVPFLLFLAASAILMFTHPSGALADPVTAGSLSVQDAWARPSIGNAPNGVAYLTITNMGEVADRLVGASASVAKRVGLHATKMEGGIMKMRPAAQGITVPAKGATELKPGGFHVMLMGLTRKLVPGQNFDLTLTFERQGAVRIAVEIKTLGYKGSSKSSATMAPHGQAHQ